MTGRSLRLLLGVGIGGVALWYLTRRGAASAALSPGGSRPVNIMSEQVQMGTQAVNPLMTAQVGSAVGSAAGASIGLAIGGAAGGPVGAVIGSAVGMVGGAMAALFMDKPLEPVSKILITQMPYGYTGMDNVPNGRGKVYALDRYGYLWELADGDISGWVHAEKSNCGWMSREVIAVNWKVFSMMPKGSAKICSPDQIDRMPRPNDPWYIRAAFGNDALFKIGDSNDFRGPWEKDANVPPAPGTPAAWAALVGDFKPLQTTSPGEWA